MGWLNKAMVVVVLALIVNSQLPSIQQRLGDYGTLDLKIVDAHVDDDVLNIDLDVSFKNTKDFDYDVENCVIGIWWDDGDDGVYSDSADSVKIGDIFISAGETWSDTVSLSLEGYDGQNKIYVTIDAMINGFSYHAMQEVRIGI